MNKNQDGASLVEVLVAVAIVGLTAVIFLTALANSVDTSVLTEEKSTALSIAEAQLEYTQNQPYDDINDPPVYPLLSDDPDWQKQYPGYSITGDEIIDPIAQRADPRGDGYLNDDGLQIVTIVVRNSEGDVKARLQAYKSTFYRD